MTLLTTGTIGATARVTMTSIDLGQTNVTTMSSRVIAELTGSTHDNVLKTVRILVDRGVVFQNETHYTHPQNGQQYPEFLLSYRDSMVVVSGYSPELRARIIDRWQALETGKAQPAMVAQADTGPCLTEACNALVNSVGAKVLSKKRGRRTH